MYVREVHSCKTTFVNGIHPMNGVVPGPLSPRRMKDSPRSSSQDNIVEYLNRNPHSSAHVVAICMGMSKSNCVEQLRKLILKKTVRRELTVNPENGLSTYFYEVTQ